MENKNQKFQNKEQQILEKLRKQRERMNKHMEHHRQRMNEHFEQEEAKLLGKLNLKQEKIINAALKVLDKEGLDSLSLRKLASLLNLKAPALYWHFENKELLIDYMAEAILNNEFKNLQPRNPGEDWQDWLLQVCKRLRIAMCSHRDGARVVAGAHLYPAVTLAKIIDLSYQSLLSSGMEIRKAHLIIMTAIHFTFGRVIEEQSSPTAEVMKKINIDEVFQKYPYFAKGVQQVVNDIKEGRDEFDDAIKLIIGDK